jgi:chemotaxis protein methyltransferase CheR
MVDEAKLSDNTFNKIADYFYKHTGILLKVQKKYLVENRLERYIGKDNRFKSFEDFYKALIEDRIGEIKSLLIQALTTNWTFFFRENIHFDFLKQYLIKNCDKETYLRIWSAGCSTGEEAYSAAITSYETLPNINSYDLKILATDISMKVLHQAISGVYHYSKIKNNIPDNLLKKYFIFDKENKSFIVKENIKNLVYFRYLNLMNKFPFQKKFDIVFLRNVLIYFDRNEKEYILYKIYDYIKENGYLILGMSESLVDVKHPFKILKNSIYSKKYKFDFE